MRQLKLHGIRRNPTEGSRIELVARSQGTSNTAYLIPLTLADLLTLAADAARFARTEVEAAAAKIARA